MNEKVFSLKGNLNSPCKYCESAAWSEPYYSEGAGGTWWHKNSANEITMPCAKLWMSKLVPAAALAEKPAERPQLSAEHSNSPSEMQMGSITSRSLELIVDRAKTKTPCASNYECLVADLMGLLTGVAEPRWKNAVCFTCEGESGLPPSKTVDICEKCYGGPDTEYELAAAPAAPPVLQAEPFDKWLESSEWWERLLSTDSIRFARDAWQQASRAARLDEAKWWKRQIESRLHGMAFYKQDVENIADALEAQRIAELERALADSPKKDSKKTGA